METRTFKSAKKFVEHFLHATEFSQTSVFDATTSGRRGFVFRGQRDILLPLLPAAHRPHCEWRSFTPQAPGKIRRDRRPAVRAALTNLHLGVQLHAELRAVLLFLEAADRQGLETPLNYDEFVSGHNKKLQPLMPPPVCEQTLTGLVN